MYVYYEDQYAGHVLQWIGLKQETRYWNVWYKGKVTRMYQMKWLREKENHTTYEWLKQCWRKDLIENCN